MELKESIPFFCANISSSVQRVKSDVKISKIISFVIDVFIIITYFVIILISLNFLQQKYLKKFGYLDDEFRKSSLTDFSSVIENLKKILE